MRSQSLNGIWQYRIGKGAQTERAVPFSALAVGHSECTRHFDLEKTADKVFLRFDGINYFAKVILNGTPLGEMLAYTEYTFDVTDTVRPTGNELTVELEDLSPVFGPSAGWENFGGITRDVSLLYRDRAYIKDVFFHTFLKNNYTDADYTVELSASEGATGSYRLTLSFEDRVVDSVTVPVATESLTRSLENVHLWSPDEPNLYKLTVELIRESCVVDTYDTEVGFRELACDRHRFLLNGKHIFLQGVCKHEMVGDYGHTVPDELIEKDLRMIKDTGSNYVRLVHYPHRKKTLEIADRLGLIVSEEPGLWWADLSNAEIIGSAIEVLRRTIRRDRNHASILFWLCFNECHFTEEYLTGAARACREEDPTRLVSGANCMDDRESYDFFNRCGFDFYSTHPYHDSPNRGVRSAKILYDKPLLFTEWGGYYLTRCPELFPRYINTFYDMYLKNNDEGSLAGACFWYWAEVGDFQRMGLACEDGILKEALVDKDRTPTTSYRPFVEGWKKAKERSADRDIAPDYLATYEYRAEDSVADMRSLRSLNTSDFVVFRKAAAEEPIKKLLPTRARRVVAGPMLAREEAVGMATVPLVLGDGGELIFEGEGHVLLSVLGCVSAPKGYPIAGEYGEEAASLTVEYTDGSKQQFPLRNGMELTTVFTTCGSSRIDPRGESITPFARFSYDKRIESFLINRLDLPLSEGKTLKKVTVCSLNRGYNLLFYGVYSK